MGLTADSMPVSRWEEIRRFLHFTDVGKIPPGNTDKRIHVRPVLEKLHHSFHAAVTAEEFLSVGEMMIQFKERSRIEQHMPEKPRKWGCKVWVRCGVSGYVDCFDIHQGKEPPLTPSLLVRMWC